MVSSLRDSTSSSIPYDNDWPMFDDWQIFLFSFSRLLPDLSILKPPSLLYLLLCRFCTDCCSFIFDFRLYICCGVLGFF